MIQKFRLNPDAQIETLSDAELESRIKSGSVPPSAEVLGGEGWVRMDELTTFHRDSPRDYPPGKKLKERLLQALISDMLVMKHDCLQQAVRFGSALEELYEWESVGVLAKRPGIHAAARCVFSPAFGTDAALTLVFSDRSVEADVFLSPIKMSTVVRSEPLRDDEMPSQQTIEAYVHENKSRSVCGGRYKPANTTVPDSVFASVRRQDLFDRKQIVHRGKVFTDTEFASEFMPRTEFHTKAIQAVSCDAPNTRDGIFFDHIYCSPNHRLSFRWKNPSAKLHAIQAELAFKYEQMFEHVMKTGVPKTT